jgi:transcriptional regulator with XRE-family HTH domain
MMLHEELKELRLRKKISARKMAEMIGCWPQAIQAIERGDNVGIQLLHKYVNVIGYYLSIKKLN